MLFGSIFGGIAQLAGAAISSYTQVKMEGIKAQRDKDADEAKLKRLEIGGVIADQKAESRELISLNSQTASVNATKVTSFNKMLKMAPKWVVGVSALVRPLTSYMAFGIYFYLLLWFLYVSQKSGIIKSMVQMEELVEIFVLTGFFDFVSFILVFWFGERMQKRRGEADNGKPSPFNTDPAPIDDIQMTTASKPRKPKEKVKKGWKNKTKS